MGVKCTTSNEREAAKWFRKNFTFLATLMIREVDYCICVDSIPEGSDGYVIHCDASKVDLGRVLIQRDDALSRLSMGSVAHVEEQMKEFTKDVHWLARLGVGLTDIVTPQIQGTQLAPNAKTQSRADPTEPFSTSTGSHTQ
ncbi:hypothetical protein MTR67_026733 [Solanum verrucosum]|uniref:Reverse transcriptase/retrotransposon-derived protein RNase H-like domain-containing protein n=1 Tax=Solanum verrucosum TaxID=315347 RepID=A0AAF0R3I1_SOLVR|nr:hypothetical protein MTR67_026733 [Solanum verrucosum]